MTDSNGPEGAGMPRWLKILLLGAIAVVLLVVAMSMVGAGEHNPMQHFGG